MGIHFMVIGKTRAYVHAFTSATACNSSRSTAAIMSGTNAGINFVLIHDGIGGGRCCGDIHIMDGIMGGG